MSEKYETHVNAILAECPDADPKDIAEAFAKYETEFYIPPQDAMRSILRRFKGSSQSQQPAALLKAAHPPREIRRKSVG